VTDIFWLLRLIIKIFGHCWKKNWALIEIFRGMTTQFLVIGSMAIVDRTIKFVQAACKCFFWGIPKKFNHRVW
jgi:hypothetical protein